MDKSLFKNILYKILLNTFNLILPILVGPYVNRVLGPESVGKVQFVESIYNYFFIFASFGVYQYGLREMSRIKGDKDKISKLFSSMFVISLVTGMSSFILYFTFSYIGYSNESVYPMLLIFGFNLIMNIFFVEWVNEALENYNFITYKTIVVRTVYVICIFLFVKNSENYTEYAILLALVMFLNNFISFVYIKRKIKFNFKEVEIKQHLKPLFLVVIFSNANVLYTQLDRFMLGEYISTKALSFYVIPQQIMGIINGLMLSVIQVTIPRLSFMLGTDDDEAYIDLLNRISRVFFAVLFPASVGLYVLADVGVVIYGGKEFLEAGPVLAIFAIYMIAIGIDSILTNQIIYVKKKENILVRLIFIGGAVNLLLNITLLKMGIFTPTTAILTTLASNMLLSSMEYIYIKKFLKVEYYLFEMNKMKYLLYSLIFIPVTYLIKLYIVNIPLLFIMVVAINIIIYMIILAITKDDVLNMIVERIRTRGKN